MATDITKSLAIYQQQLHQGDIQRAYRALTKYVGELRARVAKEYAVSNLGFGYLDYTYFYFTTATVKERQLKFALVLNHEQLQIELWLCARNAKVQTDYWNRLKDSVWNRGRDEMPRYSVLEVVFVDQLDFADQEGMTEGILTRLGEVVPAVEQTLREVD